MNQTTKEIMKPQQAADYLGISKTYLLELYRAGKIIGHKLSYRNLRFYKDELDAWLRRK